MSLLIGNNLIVSIHYKLTDENEQVLDSSERADPLAYLHGAGNIIPGLENALTGKIQGDSLKVKIEPKDGYGEIIPEMVQKVDKSAFKGADNIEAGMAFEAQTPDGNMQRIMVTKVDGDEVTIWVNTYHNNTAAGGTLNSSNSFSS